MMVVEITEYRENGRCGSCCGYARLAGDVAGR